MRTWPIGVLALVLLILAGCSRRPSVQPPPPIPAPAQNQASPDSAGPALMIGNVAVRGIPAAGCCDLVGEESYVDLAPLLSPLSEVRIKWPDSPPADTSVRVWAPDPLYDPRPDNPVRVRWLSREVSLDEDGTLPLQHERNEVIFEVDGLLFPVRIPRGYYRLREFEPRLFGTGSLDGSAFVELRTREGEQQVRAIAEALRAAPMGPRPEGLAPDLKLDLHPGMGHSLRLERVKGRGVAITIGPWQYWTESADLLAALAPFEELQLTPDMISRERAAELARAYDPKMAWEAPEYVAKIFVKGETRPVWLVQGAVLYLDPLTGEVVNFERLER